MAEHHRCCSKSTTADKAHARQFRDTSLCNLMKTDSFSAVTQHTVGLARPVHLVIPAVIGESEMSFEAKQVRGAQKESKMRHTKILGLAAVLGILLMIPAAPTQAQVRVGVAVGPVAVGVGPAYIGPPPVCAYGYYPYAPYACAPYGYYGPEWFDNGIFLGVGPWYGWGWHHGWDRGGWGRGYYGGRGFGGRGFHGGGDFHGGFRGNGGFHGGNAFHGGGGFHGNGGSHSFGGGGFHGGGSFHGGGGFHGGGRR